MDAGLSRGGQTAAWQAIVREKLGDICIGYDNRGAPIIDNGFISVSHTKGWVAVIFDSEKPCAVDIELRGRKLPGEVAARFGLRSMEDWCAREARYKYGGAVSGAGRVEFLEHPELIVAIIE